MAISPIRIGNSFEDDWEIFNEDPDSPIETTTVSNEMAVQAARAQYELFLEKEKNLELIENPGPRQMYFFSIIHLLASAGSFDLAERTLSEADEKNIWQGFEEQRAKAYTYLIEKNLEKGIHENARALYSRGIKGLAWEGFVEDLEAAKKSLILAGFRID